MKLKNFNNMKKTLTILSIALICMATGCKKEPVYTDFSGDCKAVDLGITTKDGKTLKWAVWNVGSQTETGRGDFYSWGETARKVNFTWDEYAFGTYVSTEKPLYGMTGYTGNVAGGDGQTVLLPADDVATKTWGTKWRTPTYYEFKSLLDENICEWIYDEENGGYVVKSKTTGNSIFLPFSGYADGYERQKETTEGWYWTSNCNAAVPYLANTVFIDNSNHYLGSSARYIGCVVRAVTEY